MEEMNVKSKVQIFKTSYTDVKFYMHFFVLQTFYIQVLSLIILNPIHILGQHYSSYLGPLVMRGATR